MNKLVLAGCLATGAVLGLVALNVEPRSRYWTTDSSAARSELLAGLDDAMKNYMDDARQHYLRAIELDPEFSSAKALVLPLLFREDPKRFDTLLLDLQDDDLSRLTDRERYQIQYSAALFQGPLENAIRLNELFLETHPDDPLALWHRKEVLQRQGDMAAATETARRIIEVEPNWVLAHNFLGYAALASGDFAAAEEHFRTYQYVAPNQANPHDSLGELLLITGRYEEAMAELETAIELRDSFFVSYRNLLFTYLLQGRIEEAREVLDRARLQGSFRSGWFRSLECSVDLWQGLFSGDWETAWAATAECPTTSRELVAVLRHRAALLTGRRQEALALEKKLKHIRRVNPLITASLDLMQAQRAQFDGDLEGALRLLDRAEQPLVLERSDTATLKLLIQLQHMQVLQALGKTWQAREVRDRARTVNPRILELDDLLRLPSTADPSTEPGTEAVAA